MTIKEQIKRLTRIIGRLTRVNYEESSSLINYLEGATDGYLNTISLRTLQRDIRLIEDIWGIKIEHKKHKGYYISEKLDFAKEYDALLRSFELLSRIDNDSVLQQYVISEHRLPSIGENFHLLLSAIRNNLVVEFDYELYRQEKNIKHYVIEPYFLKESQHRWYLVGYTQSQNMLTFSVERITSIVVMREKFRRKELDIANLYNTTFGIWIDERLPIERIVLRYSSLDGNFIKSLPMHHSQKIVSESDTHITIELTLRVTNDFVMELLSRSSSIEILEPLSLRKRFEQIFASALVRNRC